MVVTDETSSTLCAATYGHFMFDRGTTRKVQNIPGRAVWDAKRNGTATFTFDSRNTWNVKCIEQGNPATAKQTRLRWPSLTAKSMKRHLITLRGATGVTLQHPQVMHLPRKVALRFVTQIPWNVIYTLRARFEHDSSMIWTQPHHLAPLWFAKLTFTTSATQSVWKNTAFRAPAISRYFSQMLRWKVTLPHHQILCLPQKVRLHQIYSPATKRHSAVVVVMWWCGMVRCGDEMWWWDGMWWWDVVMWWDKM